MLKTAVRCRMRQPSGLWLAMRLAGWFCGLPFRLAVYSVPTLVEGLPPIRERRTRNPSELDRAVRIALRVCHLPLFRPPIYPRACLRQALALYYLLTRMGYPVEIHFAVRKEGKELQGHSWVTVDGKPIAERPRDGPLHILYTYPSSHPSP